MSLKICFSKAARSVADITCPHELHGALHDSYKEAERIRAMVLRITMNPNSEVGFISDFFEMRPDGFSKFSDLTNFWTDADKAFPHNCEERDFYISAFNIFRASREFSRFYQQLPWVTQGFLNASLSLHKTLIVRHLEDKAVEFINNSPD